MSNIYILEPPTSGKVLLKTSVGDIDIELWTKEAPKACRNFIQLCMEGYYNGTIFHRVVKGFIVQGGDPKADGTGGESIYGEPFKDEFHQRLKFIRRGLVAMANAGKDDNASQFFFTLAATPELQNKHTIFGKVTGDTLFNMLKLAEGLITDERPAYPHKINSTEVLNNPFTDIVPRIKEVLVPEKVKKIKVPGVKNFKLLSFGAEAEEDEEETTAENKKFSGKSKSTHDVLDDPKLSADVTQVEPNNEEEDEEVVREQQLQNIRKKLKTENKKPIVQSFYYDDDEEEEQENERKKRKEDILKEIKDVKREYHKNKLQKEKQQSDEKQETMEKNAVTEEYLQECDKYKESSHTYPRKGPGREEFTLNLLSKFKKKLESAKEKNPDEEIEDEPEKIADENEDEKWMTHKLRFQDGEPILAKDANTKADDWFEIFDPRNPLNKRRRGEMTTTSASK